MASAIEVHDVPAGRRPAIREWQPAAAPAPAERQERVQEALREAVERIGERRVEKAIAVLHEVLTQADEAQRRRIRLLLARAYAEEQRLRRYGVALLRELVHQNAADAEALTGLGAIYQREGLLARAEPMYTRALAADPGVPGAREGLRAVRVARSLSTMPVSGGRRGLIARLFSYLDR